MNEDYKDWQYDVANGDTRLGFENWLEHKREADSLVIPTFTALFEAGDYVPAAESNIPDPADDGPEVEAIRNIRRLG